MEEFGSISFSFPAGFSESDRRALLETPMVVRWLRKMEREFRLSRVEFVSVDWMRREPRRALFAKLRADARDLSGRPTNGIVLLRGDAVGILVVLRVEGEAEPRLLLTRQARVPAAEPSLAEIPAGMMDGSESPREVAVREMKEETGLDATAGRFLGVVENSFLQHGRPHSEINLVYELRLAAPDAEVRAAEDWIEFEWRSLQDLDSANLLPSAFRVLGKNPKARFDP